jgi:hypothetical protein
MAITQDRLKTLLHYDPISGVFTRLVATSRRTKVGDVLSCPDKNGYMRVMLDRHNYMLHRLAFLYMTDNMPDEVDHIDRNPKNNAWANLRPASRLLNNLNRGIQKNNTSGYTGVSRSSNKQKWVSHIRVNGIRIALGVFDDLDNAVAARKRAELEFWGNLQV